MRTVLKITALVLLLALAWGAGWLASGIGVGRVAPEATLGERERAFEERMREVVLDGSFTVAWPAPRDNVYSDRYEIARITKLDGDRWRFDARIAYGDVDVTLPVVVPILWAGDVPVIRIVDVGIPGLGNEFGATIVFDGDRYGGTWDHGEVGGFMYGRVVRE